MWGVNTLLTTIYGRTLIFWGKLARSITGCGKCHSQAEMRDKIAPRPCPKCRSTTYATDGTDLIPYRDSHDCQRAFYRIVRLSRRQADGPEQGPAHGALALPDAADLYGGPAAGRAPAEPGRHPDQAAGTFPASLINP